MHDPMIRWPWLLSLSQPGLEWLDIFSSFPPCPPPQRLASHAKPFMLNFTYLGLRIYKSGEMSKMTFLWPRPKVTAVALIKKKLLVFTIKWETLIYSLQNLAAIHPNHAYYLVRFWSNSSGNVFWRIFFKKFRMCFFKVILRLCSIIGRREYTGRETV